MWAVVSGMDIDSSRMKEVLKVIKNKLAVGGTIKSGNIEVLFGKTDKTKDLIEILSKEGFDKDAIHIST